MRKNLWLAGAAVGLCLAVPGFGRAGLITFDEPYVAGVPVASYGGFQYAAPLTTAYGAEGVLFSGPSSGSGGVIVTDYNDIFNFGVTPYSGNNILAFNRNASIGGLNFLPPFGNFPTGTATDPETLTFASTQSQVSIMAAGGLLAHQFLIQGFDPNGNLVNSQTLTTQGWSQLTVSGGDIQSVVLTEIGGAYDSWVYDDLSFTPDGSAAVAGSGDPVSAPAPEPCGLVLLSLGGVGLAGLRWRMEKRMKLMAA